MLFFLKTIKIKTLKCHLVLEDEIISVSFLSWYLANTCCVLVIGQKSECSGKVYMIQLGWCSRMKYFPESVIKSGKNWVTFRPFSLVLSFLITISPNVYPLKPTLLLLPFLNYFHSATTLTFLMFPPESQEWQWPIKMEITMTIIYLFSPNERSIMKKKWRSWWILSNTQNLPYFLIYIFFHFLRFNMVTDFVMRIFKIFFKYF